MKTKIFIVSVALASTLSQVTVAIGASDSNRDFIDRKPVLTAVKFIGTLRCEDRETTADHKKEHGCDLEFVNDETGEVWNVKENPTLTSVHQTGKREIKAHIEAMRSPRYILGGSYVDIKKIETLPSEVAETDAKVEPTHVCSLDANWGKN